MKLRNTLSLTLAFTLSTPFWAQTSSSSISSSSDEQKHANSTATRGVERAGSAISLETSEALFTIAAGLNACGYNADMDVSLPVRAAVRKDIDDAIAHSEKAQTARKALCDYMVGHQLVGALNLAQYVSLGLYTTQPPELTPSVSETELPPDSTAVVNVLPLLRTFSEETSLHLIWVAHRAEYEAAVNQVHDALTRMILNTNVYLRQPVSSYEGHRFVVLLEPMLSPNAANARVYGTDYFVVTSPSKLEPGTDAATTPGVHLSEIRHSYLHYEVEPLIYARAQATDRLMPLLKTVQDAPLDYTYKNDIVALVSECLIKAIEARTMDVGFPKPQRPSNVKARTEIDRYNEDIIDYDRRAEMIRRQAVAKDLRQGWVLTPYLYDKLRQMEANGVSLKEDIGEMVYGMDVQHEVNAVKNVQFDAISDRDVLLRARAPRRQLTPLEQAEKKLFQHDLEGATTIANTELAKDPNSDKALYLLARIDVMERKPQDAVDRFTQVISVSHDPEILAWSHIYLGRLYDTREDSREDAIAEYKAALSIDNVRVDTRAVAQDGLKHPFAPPKPDTSQQQAAPPLIDQQQ